MECDFVTCVFYSSIVHSASLCAFESVNAIKYLCKMFDGKAGKPKTVLRVRQGETTMQENICFTTYEIQLEIILSYPVHRKNRLEYRLQHVTNSADLERSYAELSLLQTVIQQGNPFCNECIFDCLKCSWVRNPADQPVADHAMN